MVSGDGAAPTPQTSAGEAAGRQRRRELPRESLGILGERHPDFDPLDCLAAQSADRVPSLLPLRDQRMVESPFTFLRGAAAVMAYDLAMTPNSGIETQLCGDAHISNFGIFSSPERRLVFDVNDFDETLRGPFEWDVKRLCASAAVALTNLGADEKLVAKAVRRAAGTYAEAMRQLAGLGNLEVWYRALDIEDHLDELRSTFSDESGTRVDDLIARARRKDSRRAFSKLVGFEGGSLRFKADPPLVVPMSEVLAEQERSESPAEVLSIALDGYAASLPEERRALLATYEQVDMARKVVGVGSVGTRCFIILLLGRDTNDPLVLQAKQASASVLEAHLGPDHHASSGERVIVGQRMMQTTPDLFLGAFRAQFSPELHRDFYFRQLYDGKASVDLDAIGSDELSVRYVQLCAWTLARAHARSGSRAEIAAYIGGSKAFEKAMAEWSLAYVERNAADHAAFAAAIAAGRVI